jgi:hypothetical protein
MWLYELRGKVHAGFRVSRDPEPSVIIGTHDDVRLVVPLCQRLRDLLSHPDDKETEFFLRHGVLEVVQNEVVLTSQQEEAAALDDQALLIVSLVADKWEGERLTYDKRRIRSAECLHPNMFIFRPGGALRLVHQTHWATQVTYDLHWNWKRRWLNCQVQTQPWEAEPRALERRHQQLLV